MTRAWCARLRTASGSATPCGSTRSTRRTLRPRTSRCTASARSLQIPLYLPPDSYVLFVQLFVQSVPPYVQMVLFVLFVLFVQLSVQIVLLLVLFVQLSYKSYFSYVLFVQLFVLVVQLFVQMVLFALFVLFGLFVLPATFTKQRSTVTSGCSARHSRTPAPPSPNPERFRTHSHASGGNSIALQRRSSMIGRGSSSIGTGASPPRAL